MSQKAGRAPLLTNALMLEGCVKLGQITSEPGSSSSSIAAISSAWVADGVSSTRAPSSSADRSSSQRPAIGPSPESLPEEMASSRWADSFPARVGRLNGMRLSACIPLVVPDAGAGDQEAEALVEPHRRDVPSAQVR